MRKRSGPWWVVLVLVGVWVGGVRAQPLIAETEWWMDEALRDFVATLVMNDGIAHDWLRLVLTGEGGGSPETCAFVAGMGSKPRLDGGGGLYAVDPATDQGPVDWRSLYVSAPNADVVIIDEFSFELLVPDLLNLVGASFGSADDVDWRLAVADATLASIANPSNASGGSVQHGHFVLHHVLALLGGHDLVLTTLDVPPGALAELERVSLNLLVGSEEVSVHLEAIDFDESESIRNAMVQVSERYGRESVVNTSWGLVDCELSSRYQAAIAHPNEWSSIGAYLLNLILNAPVEAQEMLEDLCASFTNWINRVDQVLDCSDGFALSLALMMMERNAAEAVGWPLGNEGDDGALPVDRVFASAGNQMLPFPMPPAAWPRVFGVAACGDRDHRDRAEYSNVGDFLPGEHLMAPGGWFSVGDPSSDIGYSGTSFAAPHAALALGTGSSMPGPAGIDHCNDPVYPTEPPPN